MTPSEKLAAVIEARGRHSTFGHIPRAKPGYWQLVGNYIEDENGDRFYGVLEILLDPEGLKAAYGEEMISVTWIAWKSAAHQIFNAWIDHGAEGAIDKAFELLPAKA